MPAPRRRSALRRTPIVSGAGGIRAGITAVGVVPAQVVPTEAVLQRAWATAPTSWLNDAEGGAWRVLFAGTWNHGPGPDFRDALLLPPRGVPLRGDLEIHRTPAGWDQHGHDRDPAYARVMLHLCGVDPAASPTGTRRRAAFVRGAPAQPPPCARVVAEAGRRAVTAALRRLGRERLHARAQRLADRNGGREGTDAAAYRALLVSLGRGGNEAVFAALVARLPWASIAADVARGDLAAVGRRLQGAAGGPLPARAGRPANAPARRLEAAARLLVRFGAGGEEGALARGLVSLAVQPEAEALAALRLPGVLGRERARQILVDAAYPLALSRGDAAQLVGDWLRLGGARYRRTAALRDRLQAGGLQTWRNGETQALLSLERCYCRAGACAVCPIARLARGRPAPGPRPSPNADFGPAEPVAVAAVAVGGAVVAGGPAASP